MGKLFFQQDRIGLVLISGTRGSSFVWAMTILSGFFDEDIPTGLETCQCFLLPLRLFFLMGVLAWSYLVQHDPNSLPSLKTGSQEWGDQSWPWLDNHVFSAPDRVLLKALLSHSSSLPFFFSALFPLKEDMVQVKVISVKSENSLLGKKEKKTFIAILLQPITAVNQGSPATTPYSEIG